MTEIPIASAAISNYEGMDALVDYADRVYLGKRENYHFDPSGETPAYYDNGDGSLQFISDNVKMFHFLYGEGWALPQATMQRQHYFTMRDYMEFASLREGILARYPMIREVTFSGRPFVPPKKYKRLHRKTRQTTR